MRYHDTEDVDSHNKKSSSYHLSGVVNKHGVRQEFCVKDEAVKKNDFDIIWPEGQYCIYKYGIHCPLGLKEGKCVQMIFIEILENVRQYRMMAIPKICMLGVGLVKF